MPRRIRDAVRHCMRCRSDWPGGGEGEECGWCHWRVCWACMSDDYTCRVCATGITNDDLPPPPRVPYRPADGRPLFGEPNGKA